MNTPMIFLVDTYKTERIKTLSIWSEFTDDDLRIRPHQNDHRGRNLLEQMIHQCVSENVWFKNMLDINVTANPLPTEESRRNFITQYADNSQKRVYELELQNSDWWFSVVDFFGVPRSRAWIVTRRIAHSSHHRGQLTYLLRMIGRDLHSTYGPTAGYRGLMQNHAPTIYLYPNEESLLIGDESGINELPEIENISVTERPVPVKPKWGR